MLYAVVAIMTARLSSQPFRPLFDGFAPPPPYRWVQPPPELARDNQLPERAERDVPLGPEGSEVANTTTPDGQAIASLEVGSVPANPPDTAVRLQLVPLDVGTLGPLPPDLRPESNAYHVTLAYQPSQTPVTGLARPGTVALTASGPGDVLLFSPDGRQWRETTSQPYGHSPGRYTALEAPGYFVITARPPPPTPSGPSRPNALLVIIVGAVPIVGAALVLRPPPPPPPPARRRRPPARKRRS
jgi:hypothetical protein